MARSKHWLDILARTERARAADALALAKRIVANTPWKSMFDQMPSPQMDLADWHRQLVEAELAKPEPAAIYLKMKRALWLWPEFAGLGRGARAILNVIVELAREEAFPWYVPVAAEEVRRLARMSTRHFSRAIPELQVLAITRPARIVQLNAGADGLGRFPGIVDASKPLEPIAQWVVRYRHGVPHNKKRAAWWINYDLLCETGRAQRCFLVSPRTLCKTYRGRNRRMGKSENWFLTRSKDGLAALEESLSQSGPLPTHVVGLRAPLWRPVATAAARYGE